MQNTVFNKQEFIPVETDQKLILSPDDQRELVFEKMKSQYPEETLNLVDIRRLKANIQCFQSHFLPDLSTRRIAYAVKANPQRWLLEMLLDSKVYNFDCASIGEINELNSISHLAKCYYNHPFKLEKDIYEAMKRGIENFTIQNQAELSKILKVKREGRFKGKLLIYLRICLKGNDARINLNSKFGCSLDEARRLLKWIKKIPHLIPGIAIHVGSQTESSSPYIKAIETIKNLVEDAKLERYGLNLGGGLGVISSHWEEQRNYLKNTLNEMSQLVREQLKPEKLVEVILEPGRALVGNISDLFIPVLGIERNTSPKKCYINDGIFTSFSDYKIHDWKYNFQTHERREKESRETFHVFGRTCDSGDEVGLHKLPSDLHHKDYLMVECSGAYFDSQGTNFNGFQMPKQVLYPIFEKPKSSLVELPKKREQAKSYDDPILEVCMSYSQEFGKEKIVEISNYFRETFNNEFDEFVYCKTCKRTSSASQFLNRAEAEKISLQEMDAIQTLGNCHSCAGELTLFHDPEVTFKKLKGKFSRPSWIVMLRDANSQKLVGFSFAYLSSLQDVFFKEWSHPNLYSSSQDTKSVRCYKSFKGLMQEAARKIQPNTELNDHNTVLCWNCIATSPEVRGMRSLLAMREALFANFPHKAFPSLKFVVNETIQGSAANQLMKVGGAVEIPGYLGEEYVLMIGDYKEVSQFHLKL